MEIYVSLKNEGVICYRPVPAERLGVDVFRIMATDNYDQDDEAWEFLPGSIVRAELKCLSGGSCLVAVEEVVDKY